MKITRNDKSFTVDVDHGEQAEILDALLRTIDLTLGAPDKVVRREDARLTVGSLKFGLDFDPSEIRLTSEFRITTADRVAGRSGAVSL